MINILEEINCGIKRKEEEIEKRINDSFVLLEECFDIKADKITMDQINNFIIMLSQLRKMRKDMSLDKSDKFETLEKNLMNIRAFMMSRHTSEITK